MAILRVTWSGNDPCPRGFSRETFIFERSDLRRISTQEECSIAPGETINQNRVGPTLVVESDTVVIS